MLQNPPTTPELAIEPCGLNVPRIYLPVPLATGATVTLDKQAAQHVVRVLRLRVGETLILFNGEGGEFEATLDCAERNAATVKIGRFIARSAESKLAVTLALGISRGERMDYAIQKAVEMGVTHIMPLFTEFCMVNIHKEREEKRLAHWQGIIIAACEQCGRNVIPTLSAPLHLKHWLADAAAGLKLLFDPYVTQHLTQLAHPSGDVIILIGPEGGLSDDETTAAKKSGFSAVHLGPRMLRTETAPVAALSAVQTLWGDLG